MTWTASGRSDGRLAAGRLAALDRFGIGLSGLCLVHCLATTVFVAVLASAGSLFVSPHVHEFGLAIAIPLGVVALGRGIWKHGYMMPSSVGGLGIGTMAAALSMPHGGNEVLTTLVGVGLLALGHDLNGRASRQLVTR